MQRFAARSRDGVTGRAKALPRQPQQIEKDRKNTADLVPLWLRLPSAELERFVCGVGSVCGLPVVEFRNRLNEFSKKEL